MSHTDVQIAPKPFSVQIEIPQISNTNGNHLSVSASADIEWSDANHRYIREDVNMLYIEFAICEIFNRIIWEVLHEKDTDTINSNIETISDEIYKRAYRHIHLFGFHVVSFCFTTIVDNRGDLHIAYQSKQHAEGTQLAFDFPSLDETSSAE